MEDPRKRILSKQRLEVADMSTYSLVEMIAQPFAYVSRRARMADIPKEMQEGFAALMGALGDVRVMPAGAAFCHYRKYDDRSATFDLGFPVRPEDVKAARRAGLNIGETVSGRVMKAIHIGPYETLNVTYEALLAEMKSRGLEGTKDMWEAYFSPRDTPAEEIRTEVYWPVKSAA